MNMRFSQTQSTAKASVCTALSSSHQGVYYDDWNIKIKVKDRTFYIHKYVIEKFDGLKEQIAELESQGRHSIRLPGNPIAFENTFRLLYSTSYNPFEHGIDVLVSALRLATKFSHQDLCAFVMPKIKLEALPREDLIQLVHEIDLPEWRNKSLAYLSSQPHRLKLEEAEILGIELVVEVVSQRERLPRRALSRIQSTIIPSFRPSSTLLTEKRLVTQPRPPKNRGEAWASFLSRTREKAREISIDDRGREQESRSQPGGSVTARRLFHRREASPVGETLSIRQKRPRLS